MRVFFKIIFILYFSFLTWILLKPRGEDLAGIDISFMDKILQHDKIIHFIVFFILTLVSYLAFKEYLKIYTLFIIIISIYGLVIEILQECMGLGRTFEWLDMLADFLGTLSMCILLHVVNTKILKKKY